MITLSGVQKFFHLFTMDEPSSFFTEMFGATASLGSFNTLKIFSVICLSSKSN